MGCYSALAGEGSRVIMQKFRHSLDGANLHEMKIHPDFSFSLMGAQEINPYR